MMKRVIKHVARAGWRLTGPVRRPIGRKVDSKLARVVSEAVREEILGLVHPKLDAIDHNVNLARGEINAHGTDTNLTLDSLVREIGRLQMQIETLQDLLADRQDSGDGLSVISARATSDGNFASGHSKVG